jgi:phosphatidylinositol alpha-mannosyltransferase
LRVALVIDDSLDRPDGVQQYVLVLGAWLTARGHEVHYVTASSDRTDLENLHVIGRTVQVTFNGNRLGTPLPVSRREARDLLASIRPDVVHVQMPYSPLLAGRVVSAAPRGTAVVGTFHIYPQSRLVEIGAHALGRLERRRLRRFDTVMAVSEAAQDFARRTFGLRTRVVGNPVDLDRFVPRDGDADDRTVPRIVFLGRLVERKGPRELVRALVRLRETAPDLRWHATVAGRGGLLPELRRLAREGGVGDRVDFPGFLDEADKPAFLASADLVALPSTGGESFGISVVEALAASGGPVLAGDNPGYRTVMRGLEDQLVVPGDTDGFAAELERRLRALDDAAARARVAERQRTAAARFDVDVIGTQVEKVYREALAQRP